MPLIAPAGLFPRKRETNLTAAARQGATVTAGGTAHTKNTTWTQLIAATAAEAYGIWIKIREISTGATVTSFLMDIGIGAAGSEIIIIPDLNCWGAPASAEAGWRQYFFPIYIPSGVRLAATAQAAIVSDTARVAVMLAQDYEYAPTVNGRVNAYGKDSANSRGTSVTPASGAFGSWTQIAAATAIDHRYWTVSWDGLADTTLVNTADNDILIEIGFGPNSSSVQLIGQFIYHGDASENIVGPWPELIYMPVPSGSTLWARLAAGGVEARGVMIYGVG